MKFLSILSIILISLFALNSSQIVDQTVNNVTISAVAEGGVLGISSFSNKNQSELETITIQPYCLVERDANGTAISDPLHTFEDFANLKFEMIPFENITYNNIPAWFTHLVANNFTGTSNNFALVIQAGIFSEKGNIEIADNDEYGQIGPGYVKFGVMVNNWSFCQNTTENPCQDNQIGSYLDLSFVVTGPQAAANQNGLRYKFGESELLLSKYILTDDNDASVLPSGFPKYQRVSNLDVFTIRIPKFEVAATYDPIVVMESVELSHSHTWLILAVIVFILAIALVVFIVVRCFRARKRQEALMP